MNIELIVLASVLSASVMADEKKISQAKVPKPVIDRVKQKYAAAHLVRFEVEHEGGKTTYEVGVVAGTRKLDVSCSPDGKIVAEEEAIAASGLPDAVKQSLRASAKYGSWELRQAERVVHDEKNDAPDFEVVVTNGHASAELVFSADGKLIKTEEK